MLAHSTLVPAQARSAALVQTAAELGTAHVGEQDHRRRTALLGLHCLAAFSQKQFDLFEQGFAKGWLASDPAFPQAFLLEAMGRQVAFDIDVLLRTISQRAAGSSTAAMRSALLLADRLGAGALVPAVQRGMIEETAVLTYFQKTPVVRLLPYVPLALIGIDLGATQDKSRLLAIAHEAGHHVYRQMTVNYTTDLDEQVGASGITAAAMEARQQPAWLLAWEEEIFADVYSVVVGGPVAGLSIQSMLMAELPGVLLQDDGDHPLGALRPEIAIFALQKLAALPTLPPADATLLQNAAASLQAQWNAYLATQKIGDAFTPAGGGAAVDLAAARLQLRASVDALLTGMAAPLLAGAPFARWSQGLATAQTPLAELYTQFDAACAALGAARLPELAVNASGRQVAVTPQVASVKGGKRVIGQIGDPYLDELRDEALAGKRQLTPGAWKAVFLAGDWVTEEGGSGITPVK